MVTPFFYFCKEFGSLKISKKHPFCETAQNKLKRGKKHKKFSYIRINELNTY